MPRESRLKSTSVSSDRKRARESDTNGRHKEKVYEDKNNEELRENATTTQESDAIAQSPVVTGAPGTKNSLWGCRVMILKKGVGIAEPPKKVSRETGKKKIIKLKGGSTKS